jgi:hypothetical protein
MKRQENIGRPPRKLLPVACSAYVRPWRWKQYVTLKSLWTTRLHGVTSQIIIVFNNRGLLHENLRVSMCTSRVQLLNYLSERTVTSDETCRTKYSILLCLPAFCIADHRSKVWTLFASSNAGVESSDPTRGMDICVCLFCVCAVLCVGSGLVTGWSPDQGVLSTVYRITKLKNRSGPDKGL